MSCQHEPPEPPRCRWRAGCWGSAQIRRESAVRCVVAVQLLWGEESSGAPSMACVRFDVLHAMRLIQGGTIDLVRHLLSCNDQPSIKIAE